MDTLPDTQCDKNTKASRFPNEIWAKIFSNLSHGDLLQVNLVCKAWYHVACMPQLKRKSKLVITRHNVRDVCDFLDYKDLKYENVLVLDKYWGEASNVEYAYLFKIFDSLASDVTCLTLYQPETLLALNNVLPNLRTLDIENMLIDDDVLVDFTKFPNLKSIVMPQICDDYLMRRLVLSLAQPPRLGLEKLSLFLSADCLDVLSMCASSLRWLKIGTSVWAQTIPTDRARLQETFTKFTQLEVLDIYEVENIEDARLILETLPKENYLKTLRLNLSYDETLLELIVRKWPDSLECLELGCCNLTQTNVKQQLSLISGKLRRFHLCEDGIGSEELLHIIAPKKNKKLNELKIHIFHLTGPLFFLILVERLPNLTSLELERCVSNLTDENLSYIFRYLTQLRILCVGPCSSELPITHLSSKPNIANLKHLQALRSCFCPIKVLQDLHLEFEFKELNHLQVHYCKRSGQPSFPMLMDTSQYLPALEYVGIKNLRVDKDYSQEICKSFPRLKRFLKRFFEIVAYPRIHET